jgi:ribosome maturation factor RimP
MDKIKVENLLIEALSLNEELFLVEFNINELNHITVVVDGDNGVNVKECIRISRHIENSLDREEEDFSLEVSSFDIAKPLIAPRQYTKNIGRKLKVKTTDGEKYEGTLTEVLDENKIKLVWKERVPKTIGKGKVTVEKEQEFEFSNIKEAKVVIIF